MVQEHYVCSQSLCHLSQSGLRRKAEDSRSRDKGELVTSQPSYIRASDVIYVIFLTHAQTVDTRLSFSTRPPTLEPGDEARMRHERTCHVIITTSNLDLNG